MQFPLAIPQDQIAGIEVKNVAYSTCRSSNKRDLLTVKEVYHLKNGDQIPNINLIYNFQRPIFITKPNHRIHQDKKEHEQRDKLDVFYCTQAELPMKIQQALGNQFPNPNLRLADVCKNPYVYFGDLHPITMIKDKYKKQYPKIERSLNKLAVLDIETNVLGGPEEPILCSVTMGKKKIIGMTAEYRSRLIDDPTIAIPAAFKKYLGAIEIGLGDDMRIRNLPQERGEDFEIIIRETAGEMLRDVIQPVHDWMPDFLVCWNVNFDIKKILEQLKKDNIYATDVFCDPKVPEDYRNVYYREAKTIRVTNSKTISQHPADLWHVLDCQAGFYVIDAMVTFKKIRVAEGNEASYGLDYILKKHLGTGKLKFEGAGNLTGLKWHQKMQRDHPLEYIIYNIYDTMSVELLDEQTGDICSAFSILSEMTPFDKFNSLPRRLVDGFTFYCLERGLIVGTAGTYVENDIDARIISMKDWIVTLPAHLVENNGVHCIEEWSMLQTMFRNQVGDDDIAQAYPTGGVITNASKETTAIEVLEIEGVSEEHRRQCGINFTGGYTNTLEVAEQFFKIPNVFELERALLADIEDGTYEEIIAA